MSAKFQIHAENDDTAVMVAEKCTFAGALIFALEIAEFWNDITIREYADEGNGTFLIVARISRKGLLA